MSRNDYTANAVDAVLEAVEHEHDFSGWLAGVLATAAAELGSTHALIAGRPGSWEADLVHRMVGGTVDTTTTTSPTTAGAPPTPRAENDVDASRPDASAGRRPCNQARSSPARPATRPTPPWAAPRG
jgi:hypothetical protein